MPRKKIAQIRARKAHNTKKIKKKFEPKTHLTVPYRNYAKKENAQTRDKKAYNTTVHKLCQEKIRNAQIRAKIGPTKAMPKKKKMYKFQRKGT